MSPLALYELFKESTGNLAFLHGTLLIASTYQALRRGVPLPTACYYHSALTIRQVNASLESYEGQISEGTLATIACLVIYESAVGPTTSAVHIDGLEALVNFRRNRSHILVGYLEKLVEWYVRNRS